MPKSKRALDVLPVSPITQACPFCRSKPRENCTTEAGGFSRIHVARIKAAARIDAANKRKRP
jgi:hypothetical protein